MPQTNPRWLIEKAPGDLKAQVRIAVEHGYQVVSQTHTTAQLMRKKQFSCLIATVLFLCFAIPFFIYLFYYIGKKDDYIYLDIETQPSKEELQKAMKEESKKIWFAKHPIATVFIILFGLGLIGTIAGQSGSNSTTTTTTAKQAASTTSSTQPSTPVKPEDAVANKVKDALPELRVNGDYTVKGSELGKEDSDAPKGTQMLTVKVNVDSFLDQEWLIRDTGKISSEAFKQTFASGLPIYDAFVWYYGDTTDKYGNKTNDVIMTYHLNKKVFDKINWDNFNPQNLCNLLIDEGKTDVMSAGCQFLANVK
jgi:hypothetical protein